MAASKLLSDQERQHMWFRKGFTDNAYFPHLLIVAHQKNYTKRLFRSPENGVGMSKYSARIVYDPVKEFMQLAVTK